MGGPPSSLLTKDRGKQSQPIVSRPARSAKQVVAAHGPHRLSVTHGVAWLATYGGLASFPGWLPPINTRGGAPNEDTHTPHTTPSLLLSSHLSETCLREFRSRGTQEGCQQWCSSPICTSHESEEELGDVPDLLALFSACTSTDAYSIVSVQEFLI